MKLYSMFALVLSGAVGGAGFIIACSDDSPGNADAGTCECAAAEPPLNGRIVRVRDQVSIAPNEFATAGPACAQGGTVLGGSCRLMSSDPNVLLSEAGIAFDTAYTCRWKSTSAQPATGIGEVVCLMPAQ